MSELHRFINDMSNFFVEMDVFDTGKIFPHVFVSVTM